MKLKAMIISVRRRNESYIETRFNLRDKNGASRSPSISIFPDGNRENSAGEPARKSKVKELQTLRPNYNLQTCVSLRPYGKEAYSSISHIGLQIELL
jgi:hypothetical protein